MVERLNFYDFYGYLLPGLALIVLLWAPFGIAVQWWPQGELVAGVALLALAYFIGMLLQFIAESAFPSKERDLSGSMRLPSDILLDSTCGILIDIVKQRVAELAKKEFGLDLAVGKAWDKEVGAIRGNAFMLARNWAFRSKRIVYSEQFQGMYAMMLGLAAAFGLGFAYLIGWLTSSLAIMHAEPAMNWVFGLSLFFAICARWIPRAEHLLQDRITLLSLAGASLSGGNLLGSGIQLSPESLGMIGVLAVIALFCCQRFYARYHYFAGAFAKAVWLEFAA
jgi:hypothetical protein